MSLLTLLRLTSRGLESVEVSGVSREKGEILDWREGRNHRTPPCSSIHDNKKSKNKKPQQRDSNPSREQMLPQTTIHSMFLAPVNQTHAHNPNQKFLKNILTLETFPSWPSIRC